MTRTAGFAVAFPLFGKARGESTGEIGLLVALASIALVAFGIPVTWLGSRGWSKRLLATGPLVAATGLALLTIAPDGSTWLLRLGALLSGVGGATFWILADPLLVTSTPIGDRARVFALKFFLVTIGVSLGGGLGGWIPGVIDLTSWLSHRNALAVTLLVFVCMDFVQTAVFWKIAPGRSPVARLSPAER